MPEKSYKKKHMTSFQLIIMGFAGVILLGTVLLMLPFSSAEKVPHHFMRHFLQPLRRYVLQVLW